MADVPAIARVHVQSWRTTYRGLLPDDLLAGLSTERREEQWRRSLEGSATDAASGCVYVLEREGDVIGFANGGPEREAGSVFDGELYAIYLLEEHQGHGYGRALFTRVAAFLSEHGCTSMRVWVLAGNPAEAFYRRLGGARVAEKLIEIGGVAYSEVAYGWRELRPPAVGRA
jgi:GNAT superfamily N-acetyltransferase